jgi:hypothetical protein
MQQELDGMMAPENAVAPPEAPARELPVSEAEQRLAGLRGRLQDAQTRAAQLAAAIPDLEQAYHDCVVSQSPDASECHAQLMGARSELAELTERSTILSEAIPAAERTLEQAVAARAEREREHWRSIAAKLPGSPRKWCALIRGHGRPGVVINFEPGWGRKPVPSERVQIMRDLEVQHPFRDHLEPEVSTLSAKILVALTEAMTTSELNNALSRKHRISAVEKTLHDLAEAGRVRQVGEKWERA